LFSVEEAPPLWSHSVLQHGLDKGSQGITK